MRPESTLMRRASLLLGGGGEGGGCSDTKIKFID